MRTVLPARTSEFLITQKCNLNCAYCFEKCKSHKDIDFDKMMGLLTKDGQFATFSTQNFYIFGGEPLMNMDFVEKLLEYFDTMPEIGDEDRKKYIGSITSNLITNGVLINRFIPILKKHGIGLQVSIDGPEDINDKCRVDHKGRGHFKQIMKNLELCRENGIPYSLHGACSRANYSEFARINEFFLDEATKNKNRDIENVFYTNYCQIVFEDEITDDDIDILLVQFYKTVEMIMTTPLLDTYPKNTRKLVAEGFLNRRGGICSAGNTMFSYDDDFNVFPCHRVNTSEEDILKNRFTSLVDDNADINYLYYEQFQEVARRREMYSAYYDNHNFNGGCYWLNWCPATNSEVSGNVFQIPSKYDTLEAELQRFLPQLADYFDLDIDNPRFHK